MKTKLKKILSKRFVKDELILFINSDSKIFKEAINLALSDNQPQAWRAAWLLGHCMQENDKRLTTHLKAIIEIIDNKKNGHQRELLKIEKMEIDEEQEGRLFNICMNIWETINKSSSVRIAAFRLLIKIVKKYPELNSEIEFLSQEHYIETLSPGIKHSFEKIGKHIL